MRKMITERNVRPCANRKKRSASITMLIRRKSGTGEHPFPLQARYGHAAEKDPAGMV